MNAKIFFDKIRQIIKEEIQRSTRKIIKEEIQRALDMEPVPAAQPSLQEPKKVIKESTGPRSIKEMLEDTEDEMTSGAMNFTSKDAAGFRNRFAQIQQGGESAVPAVDINGRPTENVDPSVVDALTKDYSKVMKAMKDKKGKS